MQIDLIGFDADDTLWQTEVYYLQAQHSLEKILNQWESIEKINESLYQIQINNLSHYGYGIKAYVLTMIETAVHISGGEIRGEQIEQILNLGKKMLDREVVLRPYVEETLKQLSSSYRMMILTKGDLLDQTNKVKRSGLASFFFAVEVVTDKTPEAYTKILNKHRVSPENFLMVGNTIRSDVEPVLKLGGAAVHIPADTTWEHEIVPGFDTSQNGFYSLKHIGQLVELITQINNAN